MAVAKDHGLKVIEDAACCRRAMQVNQLGVSEILDVFVSSSKIIVTGEGMCTTNQEKYAKILALRNHGAVLHNKKTT